MVVVGNAISELYIFMSLSSLVVLDQSGLVDEERENAPSVLPVSPLQFDSGVLLRLFIFLHFPFPLGPTLFILWKQSDQFLPFEMVFISDNFVIYQL